VTLQTRFSTALLVAPAMGAALIVAGAIADLAVGPAVAAAIFGVPLALLFKWQLERQTLSLYLRSVLQSSS
jgi:hypothetical protein